MTRSRSEASNSKVSRLQNSGPWGRKERVRSLDLVTSESVSALSVDNVDRYPKAISSIGVWRMTSSRDFWLQIVRESASMVVEDGPDGAERKNRIDFKLEHRKGKFWKNERSVAPSASAKVALRETSVGVSS